MEKQAPQAKQEAIKPKETQKLTREKHAPLSAKEKQALLNEQAKTKKRLEDAKRTLIDCKTLLNLFPLGELKKEAQRRYEQAKEILNKATEDFKALIPEAAAVVVANIIEGIKQSSQLGFDRLKDLESLGIPPEIAAKYLSSTCDRSRNEGLEKMEAFMINAVQLGVHYEDAFALWSNTYALWSDKITIQTIGKMKEEGVSDYFFATYILSHSGYPLSKERSYFQESFNRIANLDISRADAIQFAKNNTIHLIYPQDIEDMKKAGVRSNFFDMYDINRQYTIRENPAYTRAAEILQLKSVGLSNASIVAFLNLNGNVKGMHDYIITLLSIPSLHAEAKENIDTIADMYQVEKDPNKAVAYINILVDNGLLGSDLHAIASPLYQLVNRQGLSPALGELDGLKFLAPMEVCIHILKIGKRLESHGIPLRYAILLAATSRGKIMMHEDDSSVENDILKFKNDASINNLNSLVILRELSFHNVFFAKDLFSDNNQFILNRDAGYAISHIGLLRNHGMADDEIVAAFAANGDVLKLAANIQHFFQIFPMMRTKANKPVNADYSSYSAFCLGKAVEAYYAQPAEIEVFVRYLIERNLSISYSNLQTFIDDPTLPLCIQIYRTLNNQDPAMALRIGRSLSAQGIKTVPDRITLNAKIQEWKELQVSVDPLYIFENRNMIVLNNGERWIGDDGHNTGLPRFDGENRKKSLVKSIGPNGTVTFLSPSGDKPTVDELKNLKERTLKKITETPPPMTFFFSGHGSQDSLYMNNGNVVGGMPQGSNIDSISVEELAGAIVKRKMKFSSVALSRDIYIDSGCYSHGFIRNVYDKIKSLDGVPPIFLGESEYGQYSYSNEEKFELMYRLGERGTTIGDIRKNEKNYKISNFTIYVPNKKGQPQQVVKAEKKSRKT